MAWMNEDAAQWELWEFDERTEELEQRDAGDAGNLQTHLVQATNETAVRERFAAPAAEVMELVPEAYRAVVDQRVRSGAELAFLLHGLEFARVRSGYAGQSFQQTAEITVGAGPNETPLTDANTGELRAPAGYAVCATTRGRRQRGTRCSGRRRRAGWRVCCGRI